MRFRRAVHYESLQSSPYASLRIADFRRILVANAMLTVAREAQIVVVGWQVYALTGDPLTLGLIGLAEALPFVTFALFAGHLADRTDRRLIAVAGTVALMVSAGSLLYLTVTGGIHAGQVWPVYAIVSLSATARSFMRPSVFALSAEVVPRELYPNAVAWRTSVFQVAAITGPAIGGLLYGFSAAATAYAVVLAAMACSLVAIWLVRHRGRRVAENREDLFESMAGGLRFLWREPVLLAAMTLDLFAVLFGGATALLPAFAKLLGAGPQGLGLLRSAPAAGAILTGLAIAHRPPIRRAGAAMLGSVTAFGSCMILFAFSRTFWLSFVLLFASGIFDSMSVVIRSTLLQTRTPDHLFGRVSSINQIFIGASNEIGAFESGVAARLLGVVPSVVFGGVVSFVVVGLIAWRAPRLRQLRELVVHG